MTTAKTFIRRRGTTPVPNATVHDARLSYAALGLLTVLLARPSSAPQGYRDLMGRGLGKDATLAALRELDAAGYRHQFRRAGARGRLVTDTVISEESITREQAEEWLCGTPLTVRRNPAHGATRANGASSQVAPCGGSPEPGRPEPGQPPHNPTGSKVTTSLRSESPEDPSRCVHGRPGWQRCPECPADVECEHGTPRRYSACALCRTATRPTPTPPPPAVADHAQRAAGEHLEQQR